MSQTTELCLQSQSLMYSLTLLSVLLLTLTGLRFYLKNGVTVLLFVDTVEFGFRNHHC